MVKGTDLVLKAMLLCSIINEYLTTRIRYDSKGLGKQLNVTIKSVVEDNTIRIYFISPEEKNILEIPIPFMENGVYFIEQNAVKRAVSNFYIKDLDLELDFLDLMRNLLTDKDFNYANDLSIIPAAFLRKILNGLLYDRGTTTIYNIQKAINRIIQHMPLHKTYMNSWAVNQRLIILDPKFHEIVDPTEKLQYQLEKARTLFDRHWTTLGLADSVLADKNYILKQSLRRTVPFGFNYHNPQRNLYSTLGMKGEEKPLVMNKFMEYLDKQGISRTGWNWFTIFLDLPDVWEDQIMLDNSLKNKTIEYERRIQCFGTLKVKEQQPLVKKSILAINDKKEAQQLNIDADEIWVDKIIKSKINVGGTLEPVYNVIIKFRRSIKEGTKITNLAANKGVIRFAKLGFAINPITNKKEKIQVIVACKTVKKRKNYTQILEALFNNASNNKPQVIPDFLTVDIDALDDTPFDCYTYKGHFQAIGGKIFWGVTMDVEDMIWDKGDTTAINSRGLRVAGLKFSTVELRALQTRFGANNPIQDEILSYAQGGEDIKELLNIIKSMKGILPKDKQIIDLQNIKPLSQTNGIMLTQEEISCTFADENYFSDGFIIRLPIEFQTIINSKGEIILQGAPTDSVFVEEGTTFTKYTTNKIYVPKGNLRKCWKHSNGKLGLNILTAVLKSMINLTNLYLQNPPNDNNLMFCYKAITSYFDIATLTLSTKRGDISTYGMAVRYPYSIKGVATLSNDLPKNTIQIHHTAANKLKVKEGDTVLVERFPCLGFMSLRPQKVTITNNEDCRYTIRVSSNSLGSLSLDFDGDVIYAAAFHTKEAKDLLEKEWANPNKTCYSVIKDANKKMGKPRFKEMSLKDYNIQPFPPLTNEEHEKLIDKATGVKAHTGPVIGLAYNIMRIVENSDLKNTIKINVAVEVFLDKVANSVFKQKHGVKSLHQTVTKALCLADVETLVQEGFKRSTSTLICELIKQKAAEVGITDLENYYEKSSSNIISTIVRKQNKIYFASRSKLHGLLLLEHLEAPEIDIPSKMFKAIIEGRVVKKTPLDIERELRKVKQLRQAWSKDAYIILSDIIDNVCGIK